MAALPVVPVCSRHLRGSRCRGSQVGLLVVVFSRFRILHNSFVLFLIFLLVLFALDRGPLLNSLFFRYIAYSFPFLVCAIC